MTKTPQMPLHGPSPDEVALPNAPLVSVIAQVRFPGLLSVHNRDRVAVFQEAIRDRYPHLERQDIPTIMVVSGGAPSPVSDPLVHWRFADEAADFKCGSKLLFRWNEISDGEIVVPFAPAADP